jgi:7-keto-8-aminopelargonate synthetase-like enzyme
MTGSRLLNGTTKLHERLEEMLASFFGHEAAVTFTTGYQANRGALSSLVNKRAAAVVDKADHASIYDGCKLADGDMYRFRHNDVEHLDQILAAVATKRPTLVVVDGVFSMGGDICPLPEVAAACKRYGARLLVDDAHDRGLGGGRGTASHFGTRRKSTSCSARSRSHWLRLGGSLPAQRRSWTGSAISLARVCLAPAWRHRPLSQP